MKNRIGRKLLTATLFVVSMTSIAGCFITTEAMTATMPIVTVIVTVITGVGKPRNRHAIRDYPFGDRDFGHD
jgi:hypothetical protein